MSGSGKRPTGQTDHSIRFLCCLYSEWLSIVEMDKKTEEMVRVAGIH